MDFLELAEKRFSLRNYDPSRPVPDEIMNKILEAGRLAPTAVNFQPFKFLVVSSPEMLARVRPCYNKDWFGKAPHVLIVKGFHDKAWVRKYDGYNSIETDMTIAMDHIILAATFYGVGTCWIEAYDPKIIAEALDLKPNERVFAITPLGYPEGAFRNQAPKIRKNRDELVEYL